ncbi:VOC family protein [Jannaschia donghaensis]|uniref:VOC domain-containing protein n=1 Tax=Jannaschia donghaensis TaxID=420998 RepID=A0A0M6YG48_9RHOB|nr:VOC family protein [Jannaschia donghaensis]CTQ48247.1 hypothetical protein JDO7802_00249 [Jannaschia donghaensis]
MPITGLHHPAPSISDFEIAVTRYGERLGSILTDEWTADDARIGVVTWGPARLSLVCRSGAAFGPDEAQGIVESFGARGWTYLALAADDIHPAQAMLEAKDVTVPAYAGHAQPGSTCAFMTDRDGNRLELVQPDKPCLRSWEQPS